MTADELTPDQIDMIERIAGFVAGRFRQFAYYDFDDLKQFGWVSAIEFLESWDGNGDLGKLLMVVIMRRVIGLRKKIYYSSRQCSQCQPPDLCLKCLQRLTINSLCSDELLDNATTIDSPADLAYYNELFELIQEYDYEAACKVLGLEATPLVDRKYERVCSQCNKEIDID